MLLKIAPVLLTHDLERAVAFWRDSVGFDAQVYGSPPNFAIVSRDAVKVMIALAPADRGLPPANWRVADKTNQMYIWVDDVDSIYEEMLRRGTQIDYTIYDTP